MLVASVQSCQCKALVNCVSRVFSLELNFCDLLVRQDFVKNGLEGIVMVDVRDVQGLGFPDTLNGKLDAVFLDLPQPWLAIPSAVKVLRCNGALCSFSPCIEQVQRSCEALRKHKFTDIRIFEVLMRTYEVREEHLKPVQQEVTRQETLEASEDKLSSPPHKKVCLKGGTGQASECPDTVRTCEGLIRKKPGFRMAKPVPETRGHTGYLTFALAYTS
ncbi:hypothetical protein GOP47_0007045 [Adiantum capillus-veneris]|uniref:tRNA (adenine(58)-N(1))-methyltransferase n=1 Tax=Adiantum capillus-veneris TaxID=13818 RepID=A0A9D4UZX2_ADICA|nr:hypothetical protein GOP47_0007045 [Adiantum capillus-veneris]